MASGQQNSAFAYFKAPSLSRSLWMFFYPPPTAESLITAFLLSLFLEGDKKKSQFKVYKKRSSIIMQIPPFYHLFCYLRKNTSQMVLSHLQLLLKIHCILGCSKHKKDGILPKIFTSKWEKSIFHATARSHVGKR